MCQAGVISNTKDACVTQEGFHVTRERSLLTRNPKWNKIYVESDRKSTLPIKWPKYSHSRRVFALVRDTLARKNSGKKNKIVGEAFWYSNAVTYDCARRDRKRAVCVVCGHSFFERVHELPQIFRVFLNPKHKRVSRWRRPGDRVQKTKIANCFPLKCGTQFWAVLFAPAPPRRRLPSLVWFNRFGST